MRTYTRTPQKHVYILSAIVLVAGLIATPAHAQMGTTAYMTERGSVSLSIAKEGGAPVVAPAMINLAAVNLDQLSKKEWKQLRREHIHTLRTADTGTDVWEQAAMNVVYLSIYYRDRVNFERASTPLLETYIRDRDTQRRILALAAMHAIGDHDTMAHLAQRVHLEASPRVRRLTTAAVAEHFGIEASVKPGPARQIGGAR